MDKLIEFWVATGIMITALLLLLFSVIIVCWLIKAISRCFFVPRREMSAQDYIKLAKQQGNHKSRYPTDNIEK